MNIQDLLKFAANQGASDVHLQGGSPPMLRIGGQLRGVEGAKVPDDQLLAFLRSVAPASLGELDAAIDGGSRFAFAVEGLARFRAALYRNEERPGVCLRVIPTRPGSIESLGLPPVLRELAIARRGLTLIVGASGSGRTTTQAAMVDAVNRSRPAAVVTVESPAEFVHEPDKALFTRVDPGLGADGATRAVDRALELDPDLIVLGELDRTEVALAAVLRAVESGRHVVASMRTSSTIRALEQLLDPVAPERKSAIKARLAAALEAIVALRLATTKEGGRRPVVEVFRGLHQTRELYLANRLDDIARLMAGQQGGMQEFDRQLLAMYRAGQVSGTEALRLATDPEALGAELQAGRRPAA
ncbi:type IV pilus twitching motility protein PilT [Tautonia plasticadhaerens]|uniref:Twitching mobility protein n=1 Tax=Tautonia plasticadhaerens TaxID=2527974 RepID=A0A518H006_9BACT|nr:ATPase, T2SS/T4P/T4SS family [Tautonia plasticadhaerens]QDV34170.1 Twitching mobility protein [Tautonia plasticadhaerens]